MKFTIIISGILLLVSSCVTNKTQDKLNSFSFSYGDSEKINLICEEIQKTGDIFSLLLEIKHDTKEILRILDQRPYRGMEDDVETMADEIKVNSEKVIELSKEEWNKPDVRQSIGWSLSDKDFGSRNLYVYDPVIKNVYFQGKDHPELIERIRITQKGNNFKIDYLNLATLLEYCQLNETLMIVLEVKTNGFWGTKFKYFNLHVNLEQ